MYLLAQDLISAPVVATFLGLLGTVMITSVADRIRLGTRITVMEKLFEERTAELRENAIHTKELSERVKGVEGIIPELKRLTEAMKDVPAILSRLDTLAEENSRRLNNIEAHVKQG